MSKKKALIIVLGLALVIIVVLLVLDKVFKKPTPIQQPPIPEPIIESNYGKRLLNIESILKKSDIDIPPSLSVYSLGQSVISLEESKKVAFLLGFTGDPQSLNDIRFGSVYVWSDSQLGNLRIVANLHIVDFKANPSSLTIKTPFKNESEIVSKAKRFLVGAGLTTEEAASSPQIRYLDIEEEGLTEIEKGNANIVEVRFKEMIGQYPIINATPDVGTINVTLDRNNSIVSAYVDRVNIIRAEGEHRLNTFSAFQASLKEAKVLSLDKGNIDQSTLITSDVGKIIIENASIGYFQELVQNQLLLQPIFILTGRAQFRSGKNVSALLYLPALSN